MSRKASWKIRDCVFPELTSQSTGVYSVPVMDKPLA